ncbi:MAG TPA: iron-sulfur cluster assembly scaffold protein [Patescibacteria group bacterium]|nr:iron-sulfur cluster assembly scaffold protein [Patescibacteria group bacterium]
MDYRQEIIDHYKHPRNFGDLEEPCIAVRENNAACGDMVEIKGRLDPEGRIHFLRWRGVGCAISTAAASMLSEEVVGMDKSDLEKFGVDGVVGLLGGEINAGRMKCATLAYNAILKLFTTGVR